MIENALLPISQLIIRNQVQILLESLGVVVDFSVPVLVVFFEIFVDVPLQHSHRVKFLALILEVVKTRVLGLFKDDEFATLFVDNCLVTETQLQWLVLKILNSLVGPPLPFLLNNVRLQISQLFESFLGTFHHNVS